MLREGGTSVQVAARFIYLVEQNAAAKSVKAANSRVSREKDTISAMKFIASALLSQVGDKNIQKDWFQALSSPDAGMCDDLRAKDAPNPVEEPEKPKKERVAQPPCCGGGKGNSDAVKNKAEIKKEKERRKAILG